MSEAKLPPDPGLPDIAALAEALSRGDRRALAQAITLVESSRPDHRPLADRLLEILLPRTGRSIRIGISGAPGVGKSTFIESFGLHVLAQGHRLAVLAVDPSSRLGGGSILGDKTRMTRLAGEAKAFIRPSPAGGTLGGVARRTREAMLVAEAAGYDVVLVETVGVGQSETAVADMTDMFLLMLLPGSGDDLQGIKRGIVELADLILVNKADGALKELASRTAADYQHALRLLHPASPGWTPGGPDLLGPGRPGDSRGLGDHRALPRDSRGFGHCRPPGRAGQGLAPGRALRQPPGPPGRPSQAPRPAPGPGGGGRGRPAGPGGGGPPAPGGIPGESAPRALTPPLTHTAHCLTNRRLR